MSRPWRPEGADVHDLTGRRRPIGSVAQSLHYEGDPADTTPMAPRRPGARASTVTQLGRSAPARAQAARLEPLIGLRRERAHLEKMLRDARAGFSAVTGIHGLPGSGKTSLVEAMIAQAAGFGVVRLPVTTGPGEPNDPWRTAFEVADQHLSSGREPAADRDDGGTTVRQAMVTALRATCRQGGVPALVVFEDCRRSEAPLVEALAAAVLDPELAATAVLVVTWRDTPDGATTFVRPDFPAHRLQPLTLEQGADYLTERIGKRPESSVLAELWRGTGGNPAALLSACSHLSDEELDGLIPVPDPLPIGRELAQEFGEPVAGLEGDARMALTVAAASHMSAPVLEDALAHADLGLDALRPALRSGVLAILGDRVEFAHPLCRAAAFEARAVAPAALGAAGRLAGLLPGRAARAGRHPGCARSLVTRRRRGRPLRRGLVERGPARMTPRRRPVSRSSAPGSLRTSSRPPATSSGPRPCGSRPGIRPGPPSASGA